MLKLIGLGFVALVSALVVVVAMQPATYRIARTTTISAPPEAVFPHVNDFHKWAKWSPWQKLDPNMKEVYSGPEAGTGAVYHWSGVGRIGEGQMTLLESHPNDHIRIKLDFIKPFVSTCTTEFSFQPRGKETEVTWSLSGENNFVRKAVCLLVSMDQAVGPDFAKGLEQLKSLVQSAPVGKATNS